MKKVTFYLLAFVVLLSGTTLIAQPTTYGIGSGTGGGVSPSYFGYRAGKVSTGDGNTFLGFRSGETNTTGIHNSFVGSWSGFKNNGTMNAFLGYRSGYYNSTGSRNTLQGSYSGYKTTTGSYNTILGYGAGFNNVTGSRNVMIGYTAGYYETGSNKLYIDNTTTKTPLVHGDFATNKLTVNGNFCLPDASSSVNGNFYLGGNAMSEEGMRLFGGSINGGSNSGGYIDVATDSQEEGLRIRAGQAHGPIYERMIIKANGKVRIGFNTVATPGNYKLYVETGILTEKVKVAGINSSDWADYVFDEDYHLNSTEEVEKFIKENKHLPNVPSANEVSENGVDMVEMDATLLRQIEELWLHVIELKKENEVLKTKMEAGR